MSKYISEPEKIVYLIRHGRSKDNAAPVFQASDSPLDDLGLKQAEMIAERISQIQFDSLISSPLTRAKMTAETIGIKCGLTPTYSDLFMERKKPTSIEGKPFTETVANQTWREWEKSLYTAGVKVEDSEGYDDLIERSKQALTYLTARKEKTLVVVSHGFFIKTLIAQIVLGDLISPETFKTFRKISVMENVSISAIIMTAEFEEEKKWKLWIYNDHSHLG